MAYELVRRIDKNACLLKSYEFGRYRYTVTADRNGLPFIPDGESNFALSAQSAIDRYRAEKKAAAERSRAAREMARAKWATASEEDRDRLRRLRAIPTDCKKCGTTCDTARAARVHCRKPRKS